jgi:hypothetical protein
MPKLSDAQSILLAYAAQRGGGSLLPLPDTLAGKAAAAQKSIAALVERGLAEERETNDGAAACRVDGDLSYGVFVTAAGLAAIGIEADGPDDGSGATATAVSTAPVVKPPRATKVAGVVALLERNGGATLAELVIATGWLPHTTRAALTGLRRKGHAIVRTSRGGTSSYRVAAGAER